jgi:hypothetical protein
MFIHLSELHPINYGAFVAARWVLPIAHVFQGTFVRKINISKNKQVSIDMLDDDEPPKSKAAPKAAAAAPVAQVRS